MIDIEVDLFYFYADDMRMGCSEPYVLGYDGENYYFGMVEQETLYTMLQYLNDESNRLILCSHHGFQLSSYFDCMLENGNALNFKIGSEVSAGAGNVGTYIGNYQIFILKS